MNDEHNDSALAVAAISLFANETKGSPPEWYEINAWREGKLSPERAAEVLSYVANNPDAFQQWLDLAEADAWIDQEQSAALSDAGSAASESANRMQGVKNWLTSLFKQPLPVYGGAMAAVLMAVLIVPLMRDADLDAQRLLDESTLSFLDSNAGLPAPPAQFSTRSLENLFDDLSIIDVERHQFQLGLRKMSETLTSSKTAQWEEWIAGLPSESVDCSKAIEKEHCTASADDIVTLGQWTLLNYAACDANTANNISDDDAFWTTQSVVFNQLRERRGISQSTLFKPLIDKLDANTSAALCLRMESLMAAGR